MVVNPMEIEEAAASGLTVYSYHDLGWADLLKAAEGDRSQATVRLWERGAARAGSARRQDRHVWHKRRERLHRHGQRSK
jgi:hypothetical protein